MEALEQRAGLNRLRLASEIYDRPALAAQARWLIENRRKIEHDNWQQEPEINARTALFEELTAKGHLSRVEFDGDPDTVNGRALQRLLNGWSDNLPSEEMERRFGEIVEELTIHEVWVDIQTGRLPPDTQVVTISNFPQRMTEREAVNIGYGVLNQKGMVRATAFEGGRRTVEQISRSNSNDYSTALLFRLNDLPVERPDSTGYLSSQIIISKSILPGGVVDVQRALDSLAGPNVIYGEDRNRPDLDIPEYEDLRQVSAARERRAESFIAKLADYERQLNLEYKNGRMSYAEKLSRVNQRRKELVNEICILEPAYAKDARGAAAAIYFRQASLAMAAGNNTAGIGHLENALAVADPRAGAVCGGNGAGDTQTNPNVQVARLYQEAKRERQNWQWKNGICIVEECPTRPDKVKVGPCAVCRKCQEIYDKGENPSTVYAIRRFLERLFSF